MAERPAAMPVRRQVGVRGRLTIAASALVALVLVGGAVVLTLALQRALVGTLDDSARQRARDVATLVDTGNLPGTVPTAGGTVLVQVVDDRGRVRAATPGGDALVPLLSGRALTDLRRGEVRIVAGSRIGVSDTLRVVGVVAGPAADRRTVIVAVSGSEAARTLHVLRLVLLVGVPLLVAGFAVACWFLVGAALQPVAELRRGAGAITGTGTGTAARLPVPRTRDEVARLAATLNDMLDRLAAGGARQRAFVADAAHELRSPLASIRTQLEVARAHPEVAPWSETADGVLADVARLSRLVDDLLLLARLDDDRATGRGAATVDLASVAADVAARPGRRLPVSVHAPGAPVVVQAGADTVVRIVDNLLSNADRHARSAVSVVVDGAGGADGTGSVTVTDDGPGIPAGDRHRVFERFTRLDGSRAQDSGGSGLGLAIVRQLAQSAGGTVELHDAEPGLAAVVRLPLAPRTAEPG